MAIISADVQTTYRKATILSSTDKSSVRIVNNYLPRSSQPRIGRQTSFESVLTIPLAPLPDVSIRPSSILLCKETGLKRSMIARVRVLLFMELVDQRRP